MRKRPRPHDVLTPFQRRLLAAIFRLPVAAESFALGGGTGLAEYYAGHRQSNDFDLFTSDTTAVDALSRQIADAMVDAGAQVETLRTHAAFHRFVTRSPDAEMTLVDLALHDPPLLDQVQAVDGINVMALDDIAVGKMLALHDRVEIKDGIDLWALQNLGYSLTWLRRRALDKDRGLRDAPMAPVANLLDMARTDLPWPSMLVELKPETLHAFLERAAGELAADVARDIPRDAG